LGFILNDAQLNIGFCLTGMLQFKIDSNRFLTLSGGSMEMKDLIFVAIKAWCVFKFYMACFTQLQEYYWLKHFHHDHHLQRKFINFIYRTPSEEKPKN